MIVVDAGTGTKPELNSSRHDRRIRCRKRVVTPTEQEHTDAVLAITLDVDGSIKEDIEGRSTWRSAVKELGSQ